MIDLTGSINAISIKKQLQRPANVESIVAALGEVVAWNYQYRRYADFLDSLPAAVKQRKAEIKRMQTDLAAAEKKIPAVFDRLTKLKKSRLLKANDTSPESQATGREIASLQNELAAAEKFVQSVRGRIAEKEHQLKQLEALPGQIEGLEFEPPSDQAILAVDLLKEALK